MTARLQMIVFDLDDTLYPEKDFVKGGLEAAASRLDERLGRATGVLDVFMEILERQGVDHLFDQGLSLLGVSPEPDLIRDLVRSFRNHRPRIAPHPGVPGLLQGLVGRGARLGLITDGPLSVQRNKWDALDLRATFDPVIFTDALGGRDRWKPHPAAFRTVEQRTGLSGRALAMVGDRPDRDFPTPDSLGWRTLRMRHKGSFHEDDTDTQGDRPAVPGVEELGNVLMNWLD
ncbi:MAG: HAD hydrolase-like protein [Deltaproteobacteria bacterium]|nr:HAD hydrolase-like protein [Deltaproteobacteria bacterium]